MRTDALSMRTVLLDLDRWAGPATQTEHRILDDLDGPVLDVGCGPGLFVDLATEAGFDACGIDTYPSTEAARTGKAGNGDPLAVSDLFDLLPAFLSHHPDQENPAPTHVKRPWNRPD